MFAKSRSRARARIAYPAVLAVTAALLVSVPAEATAGVRPWKAPQQLDPVPTSVAPVRAAIDPTAELAAKARPIPAPAWPQGGTVEADLTAEMAAMVEARETPLARRAASPVVVNAGGLRVSVGPASTVERTGPTRVRVETLDRGSAARAGAGALVVRLTRADGITADGRVSVGIDYTSVASAFGGDWAGRLRAYVLPDCALTEPAAPACRPTPVQSHNDLTAGWVVAQVTLPSAAQTKTAGMRDADTRGVPRVPVSVHPAGAVTVALLAGDSSTGGDYRTTSLQPSATWSAGGSTGDFSWSYPLRMPPALGGPMPGVGFSYSSQSLDGLTSASNSQPSWLGDGFSFDVGFIERRYKACSADGHPGVGDSCWWAENATLTMSGHGGELIQVAGSPDIWRTVQDDGTRVERLRSTATANGDNDGEYWKVTTPDGWLYYFGSNHLTGWTAGKPETNSVSYLPVFGDDAGEPCYSATYAAAWCQQAYRWRLDHVVDPHGNTLSYWYARELNNYARNLSGSTPYVRESYLTRVDYGTDNRSGVDTALTGTPPARVVFTVADRCVGSGCTTHDGVHWPDVPWDRDCTSATSCPGHFAPTFWTTKRLSTVTTQVATGPQQYKDVESWTLGVQWLDPAAGDQSRIMWLNTITRTALNGTDPDIAMPPIVFGPTGSIMANRVNSADTNGAFRRYRLGTIANESGAVLGITYSPPDCAVGSKMPANPETNTYRCFPVLWTPPGGSQILDYFHKYVVTSVTTADNAGGNPTMSTAYAYPNDGAFWHYDTSELTPPAQKTWGQWRGYEQVTVTTGSVVPGAPQLQTVTKFFRGAHGDKLPSGTRSKTYTVSGTSYNDEDWFAGRSYQEIVFNGPGGAVVTDTLTEPWTSPVTASRTIDGITTEARAVRTLRTTTRTKLDGGRPDRVAVVTKTYTDGTDGTPPGRVRTVDDQGDVAVASDDQCTRITYARNDPANMHELVAEMETDGLRCSATPTTATDVLALTRTWYDGGSVFPTTPTKGDASKAQVLTVWSTTPANRVFLTTGRSSYDPYGRVLDTFDVLDRKTSTAYTPPSGGPLTATAITNPKLWITTTTYEPAWGQPTKVTDPNGRVTELAYDAAGRVTAVWMPGWSKATHPNLASRSIAYAIRASGGPSVIAHSELNTAGTGYLTSYQFYDGLLRPRQTQSKSVTGSGRVITDTWYDSRGLAVKSNAPYYTTGEPGTTLVVTSDLAVPQQIRASYDGAGRTTMSQLMSQGAEKWRASSAYGGDRTDLTPPTGGTASSTLTDARGNMTQLRQYRGPTPTGAYDATGYGYDHAGRVVSMVDPAGSTWSWAYDQLGRVRSRTSPDKGTVVSTFDNADRVATTTDARGTVLGYVYDELNRLTQTWHGAVGSGTKLSESVYDTILRGQQTSSTRWVSGAAYVAAITGYDAAYRPTGTAVTVPAAVTGLAGTYTFGTSYTANGQVATQSLPAAGGLAAETLTTAYTTTGVARKLTGTNQYVTDTTYLQTGQLTSVTYNTNTGYQTIDYDPVTKRRAGYTVQAASTPDVLADVRYGYDNAGNITSIKNLLEQYGSGYGTDDTQCFSHDYLRRLVQAWTPDSNDCGPAPTTAGLGGAAPYWLSWTFDPAGNRATEVKHATGGNQTTTYAYPAPSATRPHALTSTAGTATGTYGYDNAGNTTSRPGASAQQALTWDAEGHLATVTEGTAASSYVYDASGTRLLTRDAAGTTLHLPLGMDVSVNTSGTGASATRVYEHAGRTVATRTTAGGLSWLFADPQGSASLSVKHSGLSITRRHQTPYGTTRGTPPAGWPNDRGYINGRSDASGMVHLGAREYDAKAGRFISVDPILNAGSPQQINGYSYANATPVTLSDPTGLEPGSWCATGSCAILNAQSQTSHPMETGYQKANGTLVAQTKQAPAITSEVYEAAIRAEMSSCADPPPPPFDFFEAIRNGPYGFGYPIPMKKECARFIFDRKVPTTANIYGPPTGPNWTCTAANPRFGSLEQCVAAKLAADAEFYTELKEYDHNLGCRTCEPILDYPTYPDPIEALQRYQEKTKTYRDGRTQGFVSVEVCFILCIGVTITDEGLSWTAGGVSFTKRFSAELAIGITSTPQSQQGPVGAELCAALGIGACVMYNPAAAGTDEDGYGVAVVIGVGVSVGPTVST